MKALCSFRILGTACPRSEHHAPKACFFNNNAARTSGLALRLYPLGTNNCVSSENRNTTNFNSGQGVDFLNVKGSGTHNYTALKVLFSRS